MPPDFPPLRVDHVSIAVHDVEAALAFFARHFPVRPGVPPGPGYDGQFRWTDFFIGDWKLELIESAQSGSFVERFLARRGEGFHHLSIDVADGALDDYIAALERSGLRIVERAEYGPGNVTAFISPRTAPGILVQFWQIPGMHVGAGTDAPTDPVTVQDGIRYRVDHLAVAVGTIDAGHDWFRRAFPIEVRGTRHAGWDRTHELLTFWLAGHKMELVAPVEPQGAIARFLARRGEGFHHLAIDVDRLDAAVERLERAGVRIIGRTQLRDGRATAFLHPHDAHGVLIQLWQEPEFGGPRRR